MQMVQKFRTTQHQIMLQNHINIFKSFKYNLYGSRKFKNEMTGNLELFKCFGTVWYAQ